MENKESSTSMDWSEGTQKSRSSNQMEWATIIDQSGKKQIAHSTPISKGRPQPTQSPTLSPVTPLEDLIVMFAKIKLK